jgi:hypothetical protein
MSFLFTLTPVVENYSKKWQLHLCTEGGVLREWSIQPEVIERDRPQRLHMGVLSACVEVAARVVGHKIAVTPTTGLLV